MPELDKLYEVLSGDSNYNVGTQEEFVNKFSDAASLQELHGVLSEDNQYDVGDLQAFQSKFGVKKNNILGRDSQKNRLPQSSFRTAAILVPNNRSKNAM